MVLFLDKTTGDAVLLNPKRFQGDGKTLDGLKTKMDRRHTFRMGTGHYALRVLYDLDSDEKVALEAITANEQRIRQLLRARHA